MHRLDQIRTFDLMHNRRPIGRLQNLFSTVQSAAAFGHANADSYRGIGSIFATGTRTALSFALPLIF